MSVNSMRLPPHGLDREKINALYITAFQAMLRNSQDIVYIKDTQSRYIAASEAGLKLLGKTSSEEVIGKRPEDFISNLAMTGRYLTDDIKILESKEDLLDYVEPIPGEDGQTRYASTSKYVLKDEAGDAIGILAVLKDITTDYLSQQHQQQALQALFDLPADAYSAIYIDVDQWRIIDQRRQLVRDNTPIFCRTADEIRNAAQENIVDSFSEAASFYRSFDAEHLRKLYYSGQAFSTLRAQLRFPNGEIRWIRSDIRFMMNTQLGHLCAIISTFDVDEEKKAEEALIMAAQMDQMTKTLNRATTLQRIRDILVTQSDQTHAFFMLDLDNFKQLNDTYGHQTGDACLMEIAQLLRSRFRDDDVVGRIGGDEFFVLMKNISSPQMAVSRAAKLLEDAQLLGQKYPEIPLSLSIGISLFPENGTSIDELYANADAALYRVKKNGKNQYVIAPSSLTADASMQQATAERKGEEPMTLNDFYAAVGGDFADVTERLHSEEIIMKFLIRFVDDPVFERLQQAIDAKDQDAAFTIAHTFKGTCINMGLGTLAASAKQLTEALRTTISPEVPVLFEKLKLDYQTVVNGIQALQAKQS